MILVGGGLANSLIALCMKRRRPDVRLKIIERGAALGGNHTWSFHSPDIDPDNWDLIAPLIVASWPDQEVRFPRLLRTLATGYNSISSARLHDVVTEAAGADILLSTDVQSVTPNSVTLGDGSRLEATCVIDGRGFVPQGAWTLGYQKFLGLEVELAEPSGLARPIIMDATVDQIDGYRFVFSIPFSDRVMLIEDTYYSPVPGLDTTELEQRTRDYAARSNWNITKVTRREAGVLPIVLAGDIDKLWDSVEDPDVPKSGLRAMMFHPTTGYSLPDAVRLASRLSQQTTLTSASVAAFIRNQSKTAWRERSFYRMLNRLLFIAAEQDERVDVMERFYTLPEGLIRRFYACHLTSVDKARILIGRPPISVVRALQSVGEVSTSRP